MSRSNQCNEEDAQSDDSNDRDDDTQRQASNDLSLNDNDANHAASFANLTSSNVNCGRSATDTLPLLDCWSQHVAAAANQFGSLSRADSAATSTPSNTSSSHAFPTAPAVNTVPNPEAQRQLLYRMLQDVMRLCDTNDCEDIDSSTNSSSSATTTTPRRRQPHFSQPPDKSNEQKSPDTQ